jgi:hypothetical protein
MCGAIPPLPHLSSWRGAQLSTRTTLPLQGNITDALRKDADETAATEMRVILHGEVTALASYLLVT